MKPNNIWFASVNMVDEATIWLRGHEEGKVVPPRGHSLRCSRTGISVTDTSINV